MAKRKVKLMGILNVTPDSFGDSGKYFDLRKAVARVKELLRDGADIIDIGGESTRPGSKDVPIEEELRRVMPVVLSLRALAKQSSANDIIISIDTHKAEVARRAIEAGATMVNDVTALRGDPKMAQVVAHYGVPIVLMYSKDKTPRTTRIKKRYKDVVKEITEFLEERINFALRMGIKKSQIIIDPGMGAFVSALPKYSREILRRLREFKKLGCPILIGTSMKSFLPGKIQERGIPTLIANFVAFKNGADILRVHDVAANRNFFGV